MPKKFKDYLTEMPEFITSPASAKKAVDRARLKNIEVEVTVAPGGGPMFVITRGHRYHEARVVRVPDGHYRDAWALKVQKDPDARWEALYTTDGQDMPEAIEALQAADKILSR